MNRRGFLQAFGLGTLSLTVAACGASVSPDELDAEPTSDAALDADSSEDARPLIMLREAGAADSESSVDAGDVVVIERAFSVTLEDVTCSGHNHGFTVVARAYRAGVPIDYLGGSHLVRFTPEQLIALRDGQRLPFATVGAEGGHGHCGMAWRSELGVTRPRLAELCELRATPAVCALRRDQ